jgi:hypothetical protein
MTTKTQKHARTHAHRSVWRGGGGRAEARWRCSRSVLMYSSVSILRHSLYEEEDTCHMRRRTLLCQCPSPLSVSFGTACQRMCMHTCMYVCMYICMYVCIHACMHVCMFIYIYMYTHIHTHTAQTQRSRTPTKQMEWCETHAEFSSTYYGEHTCHMRRSTHVI